MAIWDGIKEADFYGVATHIKGRIASLAGTTLTSRLKKKKRGGVKKWEEHFGYLSGQRGKGMSFIQTA